MLLYWEDILRRAGEGNPDPVEKKLRPLAEWKRMLPPEVYHITRESGTEASYSSDMCTLFSRGVYQCLCCNTLLFDAEEKFDSGTGWPSFTQSMADNVLAFRHDASHGRNRIEVTCNICDAHLGHVFPDGPPPTYLRYCINALALKKETV